jgi:hypothetical protein
MLIIVLLTGINIFRAPYFRTGHALQFSSFIKMFSPGQAFFMFIKC